jgi:AdoMet-dependent rRNA methyltransferase SPB1
MSTIIGLDLLPIKPIRGVQTFQVDITSQKCRQIINKECKGIKADVVISDGAPNVGADFTKDAYVQNELALISCRLAADVLAPGGWFITKVFRSQDYNALLWVLKQLFKKVSATKPSSSRLASAEIFVVCEGFLAPKSIDPKMLDPKYAFAQLEAPQKALSIFHPKYGKKERSRQGYAESMGMTLTRDCTARSFVDSEDPVSLLAEYNTLSFTKGDDDDLLNHPDTSTEVKLLCKDLKILNKGDFKGLLKWRLKMIKFKNKNAPAGVEDEPENEKIAEMKSLTLEELQEMDERKIDREMNDWRLREMAKRKREKKKLAKQKAKERMRIAMGMESELMTPKLEGVFSVKGIRNDESLEVLRKGGLTKQAMEVVGQNHEWDEFGDAFEEEVSSDDEDTDYQSQLEKDMDVMYEAYVNRTGSAREKRESQSIKGKSRIAKNQLYSDTIGQSMEKHDGDMERYLKQLAGVDRKKGSDEDSDSFDEDSDEEVEDHPMYPKIGAGDEKTEDDSARTSRWFSGNSMLAEADEDGEEELLTSAIASRENKKKQKKEEEGPKTKKQKKGEEESSEEEEEEDGLEDGEDLGGSLFADGSDGEDDEMSEAAQKVLDSMPVSDKEKRKIKRRKLRERQERRDAKRKRKSDDEEKAFEVIAQQTVGTQAMGKPKSQQESELTDAQKQIRAGMGDMGKDGDDSGEFQVVSAEAGKSGPPRYEYPDHYTDEDVMETLALGQMMMKRSNAKAMIDASYNRYAFNDDNLPSWFETDEKEYNRPQMEVPREVMEQLRERFLHLASRPIKKVAEAHARKRKRAAIKMKTAKKKQDSIVDAPDMNVAEKKRAIGKALKGAELARPGKVYVVARGKGMSGASSGGSGKVKFVDKRMKADKRGEDKSAKRKSGGKSKNKSKSRTRSRR